MFSSDSKLLLSMILLASNEFNSMLEPSVPSKNFARSLFKLSYELPGNDWTGLSGGSFLYTLARPLSLAGCPPVELNLLFSLISSLFFSWPVVLF